MPLVTGSGEAATLWRKPGQAEIGKLEMLRQLFPLIGAFGSALGRAMRVGDAIDAHHPPGPYWYLHIAGVDPSHQGKGLGSASIREGLARAREDGLPAFLETATPRNVSLYQSLGFEVIDEWHVPKGGPKFWSMLRPVD
jgi:ribosomal protein S18 acetylase RimI-like enzyme